MSVLRTARSGVLVVLAILATVGPGWAEEESGSSVRLSWPELSRLLELDKDEIVLSWEELQQILVQTGYDQPPPVQVRQGKVLLSRAQFATLLAAMKAPVTGEPAPPAEYLVTAARYRGKLQESTVTVQAELSVEIFPRDSERYLKIPLFPQSIALREVLLDDDSALVVLDNGRHTLTTRLTGRHRITATLSLSTPADRNRQSFSFPIPMTPVTELEIDLDLADIEVEVAGAGQTSVERSKERTKVSALLAPTGTLQVSWRKQLPEVERGPAKVYAETLNHLTIEDDALRIYAEITLNVLQNTIPSLVLRTPEGSSVLDVQGNGLGDWRELERDGASYLEIPFDYPQKGAITIVAIAEQLLPEETLAAGFTGFEVVDAIRDKGFVGIELKSSSEVTLADSTGLDTLDVSELPPQLVNRSTKPLLFGFKYLHHPISLVLDITKHEELSVISTVVDSANGVTLFTEDGKLVHRLLFKVRNTSKQFLELQLPVEAQIWSVFVAGETVKPRVNRSGDDAGTSTILIPLNRSRQGTSGLVAFDVEIIYLEKAERFGAWGQRATLLPAPDVIISQLLWSVYLPLGYAYYDFGGSVEPEETARGFRPLLETNRQVYTQPASWATPATVQEVQGAQEQVQNEQNTWEKQQRQQQASELGKRFSPNLALNQEQLVQQIDNEAQFSNRVQQLQTGQVKTATGVLPIRVQIPTSGQVYRFAKTLVSEEELSIHFSFVSQRVVTALRLLLILLAAGILWLLRRPLLRLLRTVHDRLPSWARPVALLLLAILAMPLWSTLGTLLLLAALAYAAYLVIQWYRRSQQPVPGDQEPPPPPPPVGDDQ